MKIYSNLLSSVSGSCAKSDLASNNGLETTALSALVAEAAIQFVWPSLFVLTWLSLSWAWDISGRPRAAKTFDIWTFDGFLDCCWPCFALITRIARPQVSLSLPGNGAIA